jgi:hypothetical protein
MIENEDVVIVPENIMEPKDRLVELENLIVEQSLAKLAKMLKAKSADYHKQSVLSHIEEMVKLAHRVRSLLDKSVVAKA